MSELMNTCGDQRNSRLQFLATTSALAIVGATYWIGQSKASDQDTDRPTVWIELGGQMEHIAGQGDAFAPGFIAANPKSPVLQSTTPLQAQRPMPFNFGEEAKITLQPKGSDWVFSAAVRYGRSRNVRHVDHQINQTHHDKYVDNAPAASGNVTNIVSFADSHSHRQQNHDVVDFQVGKDVGLGLFSTETDSVINFGIRLAQFSSKQTFDVRALPDLRVKYLPSAAAPTRVRAPYFHTYHASGTAARSFRGVGPSLSWNASEPVTDDVRNGEVTLDWGANAAILFGRQKTHVLHQEQGYYHSPLARLEGATAYVTVYKHAGGRDTNRSVTVPNLGGFVGGTYRVEDFKASFGYRADFFFRAMDAGIDTRKSETLGFYGPFASISVALGG